MLLELHIKNLALIENADLEFYTGLTVLSGETGAGKSILIDSINLALGAKAGKNIIRNGSDYAYIELLFSIEDRKKLEEIQEMDIEVGEEGLIAITRKISDIKSVMRVNGEVVQAAKLRKLMSLLLDMHSQHEHQSLSNTARHLELIDLFAEKKIAPIKSDLKEVYEEYKEIEKRLASFPEEAIRIRETEILKYEIDEIENANLKENEEEELAALYKKIKNAAKIMETLNRTVKAMEDENISREIGDLKEFAVLDRNLEDISFQVDQIGMLLSEARRNINAYLDDFDYNDEEFERIGKRLDLLRGLKAKYGKNTEDILILCEEKKNRLSFLEDYEKESRRLDEAKEKTLEKVEYISDMLTEARKSAAAILIQSIKRELSDLNFLDVNFDIQFERTTEYTACGRDAVSFMISTNPGQPLKPLKDVASGGEMSRIMLAIKTVLADTDEVDTLIFDEVDAGISGRTAQKVSEKLASIGRKHQVLSITHLPQIAAMADHHYLISKHSDGHMTKTDVQYIRDEEIVNELARLIGGSKITEAVLDTAREMKTLAAKWKSTS